MSQPVIEVRNITKTYRLGDVEVHALRGVSLTVQSGEFVAIMGASGSGKSTLMNTIGCLDRPTSGDYILEGTPIANLSESDLAQIRSRNIGFVFQSFNLLARTSAAENVALPLFYSGQLAGGNERVLQMLAMLGLAGREANYPSQLSGGQQQRVAIARALINKPAILLADEPTGNLDSKTSYDILSILQTLNRSYGLTIVLVTHEPDIAAFADRLIVMKDGAVLSDVQQQAHAAPQLHLAYDRVDPDATLSIHEQQSIGGFIKMALTAAWRALGRNKLRTSLTMLGIFIGVAALVVMVSVGQGAAASVKERIESLGTNLLIVLPGASTASGARGGSGSASTLTVADAEAILAEDEAVANVAYQNRQNAQIQFGNQNWNTSIQGVSPSFFEVRNWVLSDGRIFTDEENRGAARFGVLGKTVVDNLFGTNTNPLGATIFVKNVPIEVIGVLQPKGQSGGGQDQDDVIFIPFHTAERKVLGSSMPTAAASKAASTSTSINPFGLTPRLTGYVNNIYVQAVSTALVPESVTQVTNTLRLRHNSTKDTPDDFSVRNISDITEAAESSSKVMALLLASVASISLLVGGIGIMNILLVSVTERTREIGIRMAIGARRIHVLLQFLVEAILLGIIGGSAGIVAGIAIAKLISLFAEWPTVLSPLVMLGAFVFSAAVGIFFGYYPARRAANMNPIEALRYE